MTHAKDDATLLAMLREWTGDPTVELTNEYRSRLQAFVSSEEETSWKNPEQQKMCMYLHRQLLLEIYWKPKTAPDRRRFYRCGDSEIGFLGWGEILEEVIRDDTATLERLGYTHVAVAEKLNAIFEREKVLADREKRKDKPQKRDFVVVIKSFIGYQTCPFAGCEYENSHPPGGSSNFTITNQTSREKISGPGMIPHLIDAHHFFEGKDSVYRVDPEQLTRVIFG